MKSARCFCFMILCSATTWAWVEFPVYPTGQVQQSPDVSNGVVVWQENVNIGGVWDWDIYGINLVENPALLINVAAYEADQRHPSIWDKWVAWEDNYYGDIDIWVSDISNPKAPLPYSITPYEKDQTFPAIHGNTIVWQHQIQDTQTLQLDWDIYMADITDPNSPQPYSVASFAGNQQLAAIYRNTIIWQDDYYGDNDIAGADVWLRNNPKQYWFSSITLDQTAPALSEHYIIWQEDFSGGDLDLYGADISDPDNAVEFEIASNAAVQTNPDISDHIVVWQDNRNGQWDIYGFNLITRKEFQITGHSSNQTNPAIDGKLVIFEDDRSGNTVIYAVWLDGEAVADCQTKIAGDTNGDCQVDMADLSSVATNWLKCDLLPASACEL